MNVSSTKPRIQGRLTRQRIYLLVRTLLRLSLLPARRWLSRLHYSIALWFLFEPRETDIFIVTYPKAGTTLMQMMLYQLSGTGSMDITHIDSVVPWFEVALLTKPHVLNRSHPRRMFKTHLPIVRLPRKGRYMYVVREPKDSCVSYYHHLSSSGECPPLSVFAKQFARGSVPGGSWTRHVGSCWRYFDHPRVMVIRYEDIVNDLPGTVDKVAAFCEIGADEETRQRAVERCRIEYMRGFNSKFDPRLAGTRTRSQFVRRGETGGWRDELDPLSVQAIDKATIQFRKRVIRKSARLEKLLRDGHSPGGTTETGVLRFTIGRESPNRLVLDETGGSSPRGIAVRVGTLGTLALRTRLAKSADDIVKRKLGVGPGDSVRLWLHEDPDGKPVKITRSVLSRSFLEKGVLTTIFMFRSMGVDEEAALRLICEKQSGLGVGPEQKASC